MSKPIRPLPPLTSSDIARFWLKVDVKGQHECWNWTAALIGPPGYKSGVFGINYRNWRATRLAYFLVTGIDPYPLLVCHDCPGGDNPKCVNPSHMFLGTQNDNMADMAKKNRGALGDKNGTRTRPDRVHRGESHWNAKLTEEDIEGIQILHSFDGVTHESIAGWFGVSRSCISLILEGKRRNTTPGLVPIHGRH